MMRASKRLTTLDLSAARGMHARRLPVGRSPARQEASSKLEVPCPLAETSVLLQRCAWCIHGQGLLVDPTSHELTLQCAYQQQKPGTQQGG
jgi:hypothetical protein